MKISLAAALLLACSAAFGAPLKILAFEYPPMVTEKGDSDGFVLEFIKDSLELAGIESKVSFLPIKRALKAYNQREGMMISSFGILRPGKHLMIKTVRLEAGIFGFKEPGPGAKVAYIRGLRNAKRIVLENGYKPFPVGGYAAGIKALLAGRVGAVLGVRLPLLYAARAVMGDKTKELAMLKGPVHRDWAGLVAPESARGQLTKISRAMRKLWAQKEAREWIKSQIMALPGYNARNVMGVMSEDFEVVEFQKKEPAK